MEKTKKDRIISLPQSKTEVQVVGVIKGVKSDKFYTDGKSQKGNIYRSVNFGIQYEKDKTIYVNLYGSPKKNVYFYKKSDTPNVKGETKIIEWSKRATFKQEGFSLLGISCGLTLDDSDKNIICNLSEYDACEYIHNNLKDEMVVRAFLEINHGNYTNKNGDVINTTKFILKRIYISTAETEVDEDGKKFIKTPDIKNHFFHQYTIIESVEQDKENERFVIEGKIVNYETLENITLFTKNPKLATNLKNVSKKNSFGVNLYGTIEQVRNEETVTEQTDDWGDVDESKTTKSPTITEFWITGADKDSLDTTSFTKDKVEEAIINIQRNQKVDKEFHGNDSGDLNLEIADADVSTEDAFEDWD